jgi:hypothetical protein
LSGLVILLEGEGTGVQLRLIFVKFFLKGIEFGMAVVLRVVRHDGLVVVRVLVASVHVLAEPVLLFHFI